MRITDFLRDFHIPYITGGHKHAQDGWVNVACPFCIGNSGWHLGYNTFDDYFSCWRCGGHSGLSVVRELTQTSWGKARKIINQYEGTTFTEKKEVKLADKTFLPSGTRDLSSFHKKYLEKRNFDWERLERDWELQGTGPVGSYRYRIIAPIYIKGRLVSYQGRDITNKSPLKYKACPKNQEVVEHKHTLYGLDYVPGNSVIVVEGITDCWRLGRGAVATFGIKFKQQQVTLLRKFTNRFILFDNDPQAVEQAERLFYQLSGFPGHTEILALDEGDPGELPHEEADILMQELIGRRR